MPTGYSGEGKTYSQKLGRWLKKEKEKAFDYEQVNTDSVSMIINFFRWYPDYFCDIFRDENAKFKLELPQRLIMRIFARYRNTYITGVRGLTKTYLAILTSLIEGILFPGHIVRYCAPNQKQAAQLAKAAFRQIEKSYPLITSMWNINNERPDMFRCSTIYGSEISMYSVRGDTAAACLGEECGQEGENAFPIDDFLKDIYPIVRDNRMINQQIDIVHINQKHQHIGNACSRTNKAYTELRSSCLQDMLYDKNPYEGYVLDASWITALVGNLRDIQYFKDLKKRLSPLDWLRECCAIYTGDTESGVISDEILAQSRKIQVAELKHCGDASVTYIVAHDVSYEEGQKNAKCADVVWKLTQFTDADKREKYRKQAVFIENYPPPVTEALQAQRIKDLWQRFCLDGGEPTYIVVDARAVGKTVVQELMKPSKDGSPPLCCYNHCAYTEIEQLNALPVIYPVKATGSGVDSDYEMIKYCQREWQQGNVEILTANAYEGVQAYKTYHGIKNDLADSKIAHPYKQTDGFCEEVKNLYLKPSGTGFKESRKKNSIQRDRWSAGKYGLHFASMLEDELVKQNYKAKSSWDKRIEAYKSGGFAPTNSIGFDDVRSNLLAKRGR